MFGSKSKTIEPNHVRANFVVRSFVVWSFFVASPQSSFSLSSQFGSCAVHSFIGWYKTLTNDPTLATCLHATFRYTLADSHHCANAEHDNNNKIHNRIPYYMMMTSSCGQCPSSSYSLHPRTLYWFYWPLPSSNHPEHTVTYTHSFTLTHIHCILILWRNIAIYAQRNTLHLINKLFIEPNPRCVRTGPLMLAHKICAHRQTHKNKTIILLPSECVITPCSLAFTHNNSFQFSFDVHLSENTCCTTYESPVTTHKYTLNYTFIHPSHLYHSVPLTDSQPLSHSLSLSFAKNTHTRLTHSHQPIMCTIKVNK